MNQANEAPTSVPLHSSPLVGKMARVPGMRGREARLPFHRSYLQAGAGVSAPLSIVTACIAHSAACDILARCHG